MNEWKPYTGGRLQLAYVAKSARHADCWWGVGQSIAGDRKCFAYLYGFNPNVRNFGDHTHKGQMTPTGFEDFNRDAPFGSITAAMAVVQEYEQEYEEGSGSLIWTFSARDRVPPKPMMKMAKVKSFMFSGMTPQKSDKAEPGPRVQIVELAKKLDANDLRDVVEELKAIVYDKERGG